MNVRHIARNSLWLLIGRVATAALNLLLTILIARYLGDAGFGRYAFIASLAYLGNTATTFGMDTLVIRSVARTPQTARHEAQAALILQLGLSVCYIAVLWLLSTLWDVPIVPLRVYLLILLPLAFGTVYSAILRGAERMELHLLYTLTGSLLQTGGAAILLWRGGGLLELSILMVFAQTVAELVAGRLLRWQLPDLRMRGWGVSAENLKRVARTGWVLAFVAIFAVLFAQLPILMLRALTDDATVGQFSAAARLVDGAKMLPAAIFGALFPALARGGIAQAQRYRQLFFGLVLLFVLGVGVGIFLANPIISWLYAGYSSSVPALQILLISLLPFLFRLRDSFELISRGHERHVLAAMVTTVAVAVPIFYLLIQTDALRGASWAVVSTTALQAVLLNVANRRAA